ncbi:MAG: DNA polymerase III subunit delta [Pirellulales bacterium]|nr:DNA polymerase III subunit delta [Pirellulales bacterium]
MAKKSAAAVTGFDLLIDPSAVMPRPVVAIVGDGGFLQHEVCRALAAAITGGDADSTPEIIDGETAQLRDILDALCELSLFGSSQRVVVLEAADDFIKNHRDRLEDYVASPQDDATLILEVSSWPGNTRLAKAVAERGLAVKCTMPEKGPEVAQYHRQLKDWLVAVAKRQFSVELARPAVEQLVELLPPEPGILYQEVARLGLLAAPGKQIDAELVRENVGGWRTRKTWDIIDAAADGRAADALQQLDRLLAAGEEPYALLPQMASTVRKFALAVRLFDEAEARGQRPSIRHSLERAGMPPFKLADAERQLKQIGRPRGRQLYQWLLAADLELKGYNSTKDRARRVLETLILRLSSEAFTK